MATVADIQSVLDTSKTAGKMAETLQVHGLATPEGTPEPDDGRLRADKDREAAKAPPQADASKLEHAPPTGDSGSDNNDGDSDFDSDESEPPSDEQVKAVKSVLSVKRPRDILGVQKGDAYENATEEKESIMNAFRKLVALTHPVKNSHEDARKAFDKVIRAATHLGVDSDEIDDMQIWKGDEELGEVKLDERGEWVSKFAAPGEKMDGVEEQLEQEPGLGIKEIYEEATPYILRLQVNTDDKNAIAELQNLNSRIREKNQSYGDEGKKANRFLINHETLVANYKMASSSILSLLNHPMEAKARKHFDDLNTNLKAFCKKNHYPQDWVMISPPNGYQYRVQKEATPYMRILIRNVDDADALAGLAKSNELIVQHNKERNLPEDQWNNGTICGDFISIFESAAPFIDRLAKNNADGEAKTRFDELNEQLRLVNTLYHYPSDWVMTTLLNQSEVPPALPNPIIIGDSETSQSGPIPNTIIIGDSETSQSGPIPRAMIIGGEKPGWVFDQGIDKEINACFKVGSGHRLLFCKPGRNGFPISELVAASTFGKGVVKSYLEVEGSKEVTISDKNALKKMKGQKMYISAVASVRRYLENEPKNGWKTKPVTFARLTPFGSKPSLDNPWFARSTLAQEWGQKPADTMLTAFRNYVGQEDYEYTEDEPSETDAWSEKEDAQRAWKAGSVLRNETDIAKIERLKTELAMLLKTAATQISAKGNRQPATNDDEV